MAQWINRSRLLVIPLLFLLAVIHQDDVRADVGVPPAQPGSSLSPGDYLTNVQMVSEEVQITILDEPFEASISASFDMRNNSVEDEEFEVWFPFGERFPNSKGVEVIQAEDFQAWVEGEKVEITIEKSDEWNLIWAHWKVKFPAETPITIQVSYRILPNNLHFPSSFAYILETGAGWQGVIEKAEISVKMPYPLPALDDLLGLGDVFFAQPGGYSANPDGIKWVFLDLEPTESDNIDLRVLHPTIWHEIRDSLIILKTTPDNWQAHTDLAHGLSSWMRSREWAEREGLADPFPGMDTIIDMIGKSHLKVLDLSPPDAKRYIYALSHFSRYPELIGGSELQEMFNEAQELFPENEQLVWDYERALENGLFEIDKIPDQPTSTVPEATAAATVTSDIEITEESPSEPSAPSFPLIIGMLFISTASVLIIIAIRRREKRDPPTN